MSESRRVSTVMDKAAKGLTKATLDLSRVAETLTGLSDVTEALSMEVDLKQSELTAIQAQVDEGLRKANAELNIRILENEGAVLDTLLEKQGLERITKVDVQNLNNNLSALQASAVKDVEMAAASIRKELSGAHTMEVTKVKSAQMVETATLKAQIESLNSKVSHLESANESLNGIIREERKARIEVAKASAPTVVHTAPAQ